VTLKHARPALVANHGHLLLVWTLPRLRPDLSNAGFEQNLQDRKTVLTWHQRFVRVTNWFVQMPRDSRIILSQRQRMVATLV
jgi:hypothetical protein